MNRTELERLMAKRGFEHNATSGDGKTLYFLKIDPVIIERTISCTVQLDTKKFRFLYAVPRTTFKLDSDFMSPVDNEKHFMGMLTKFLHVIDKIVFFYCVNGDE